MTTAVFILVGYVAVGTILVLDDYSGRAINRVIWTYDASPRTVVFMIAVWPLNLAIRLRTRALYPEELYGLIVLVVPRAILLATPFWIVLKFTGIFKGSWWWVLTPAAVVLTPLLLLCLLIVFVGVRAERREAWIRKRLFGSNRKCTSSGKDSTGQSSGKEAAPETSLCDSPRPLERLVGAEDRCKVDRR